jgi:hypothetical protein
MLKRIYIYEHIPGVGVYLLHIFLQATKQMRVGWGGKNSLGKKKKIIWTLVTKVGRQNIKPHRAQHS